MYNSEVKQDKSGAEHLPPIGWKWGECDSESPCGRWICTRQIDHKGLHRAGVDMWTWRAEWDDDRATDPEDMEVVV